MPLDGVLLGISFIGQTKLSRVSGWVGVVGWWGGGIGGGTEVLFSTFCNSNFPPKLGSTAGSPLYAYSASPSSCKLHIMVELSCCLVNVLTNQSAAGGKLTKELHCV